MQRRLKRMKKGTREGAFFCAEIALAYSLQSSNSSIVPVATLW